MDFDITKIRIPLTWVFGIIGSVAALSVATYEFITVEERSIERDNQQKERIEMVDKKLDQLIELYNSQHGMSE